MQFLLAVFLHVILVGVVIWDMYVVFIGRPADTVSMTLRNWADGHPILPLFIGIVIGHLLWSNCPPLEKKTKKTDDDLVVKCQAR